MEGVRVLLAACCMVLVAAVATAFELSGPADHPPAGGNRRVIDLDAAKRLALSENPGIAAAGDRVRQAAARVAQARAAYWPTVDAGLSGARISLSEREKESQRLTYRLIDPMVRLDDPEDYYGADINASWVLFDGFARRFATAAARFGEAGSREALNESRRMLLLAVAEAYCGVQLALANQEIALADEHFNRRLVDEAETRLAAGSGALSDVLNFRVQMNAATSRYHEAVLDHARRMAGLGALLGLPGEQPAASEGIDVVSLPSEAQTDAAFPDVDAMIQRAFGMRPDVRASEAARMQAAAGVDQARAGFYPTVSLSASLGGERPGDAALEQDDFGYQVGAALNYSIFSGGLTRSRVAEARWRYHEAEMAHKDLCNTVAAEVRQAVAALTRARAEFTLQTENARLVDRNRALVEAAYLAGREALVRLNEAQRDLVAARGRLASAMVSLVLSRQRLLAATGDILPPDITGGEAP